MMNDQRSVLAAIITGIMWVAVIVVSAIFMAMDDVSSLGAALFVITMAGIAVGGTAVMWGAVASAPPVPPTTAERNHQQRKAKRLDPERLARLMESLDEDQIIELETLLMAQREDLHDAP